MPDQPPAPPHSSLGRFIQTYSAFLSSFVIGVAGLVATSIWQYRQSEISARQAASDQEIARTKAENDWRIARAEILAKNLDVLSKQGPQTAEQRFGVLLSLTRGNIIDPELAVSYALELGKDNPSYMKSVLGSTAKKSYVQIAQAYTLTCIQRFGAERAIDLCKDDALEERSDALARLIQDEIEATAQLGLPPVQGPMGLLSKESDVQALAPKLAWLFEPYLQDLYQHRRGREIEAFENFSPGARLVAALVFATARTGEMLAEAEAVAQAKFHAERRKWLTSYALGSTCDPECRKQIVEFILATVQESEGGWDELLHRLLLSSRSEVGLSVSHIHARLLWCQIDARDAELLRDGVLIPALGEAMERPNAAVKKDPSIVDDLVDLLALVPAPDTEPGQAAYRKVITDLQREARLGSLLASRQARAERQRANPPAMVRRVNFCGIAPPAP